LFSTTTRGQLVAASCSINDAPTYVHRGFLVDSGRRFVPVSPLMDFMDSMSYTKVRCFRVSLSHRFPCQ
jgi:N-acetyl-beta-hexosaminidase